ncbi:MAG: alpha/beta fold hydrolase [Planctomycetota bacterium]|nr:alpha/beta fold hydrolase [Planctomycetota bacterium]
MGEREEIVRFGPERSIIGVVTLPAGHVAGDAVNSGSTAVLILNAGLIHHVGPQRLHVKLARRLARAGVVCARWDFSGIGDSPARRDGLAVMEAIVREPRDVMDHFAAHHGIEKFILVGICSGAYASFRTAAADPRVVGAALINPQDFVGHDDWGAYVQARRYMTRSIFSPRAWANLLTGRVAYQRLATTMWRQATRGWLGANQEVSTIATGIRKEIQDLVARGTKLSFIVAEEDVSVEYFNAILGQDLRANQPGDGLRTELVPRADHLFTRVQDQERLLALLERWIHETAGAGAEREELEI